MVRWLALLSLLLLVVGCAPKAPFLGTWKSQVGVALSIDPSGEFVLGNEHGKWAGYPDGSLGVQFDGETGARKSKWWVSQDGKTLTLTPLDASGTEMKDQAVTYLRQ